MSKKASVISREYTHKICIAQKEENYSDLDALESGLEIEIIKYGIFCFVAHYLKT